MLTVSSHQDTAAELQSHTCKAARLSRMSGSSDGDHRTKHRDELDTSHIRRSDTHPLLPPFTSFASQSDARLAAAVAGGPHCGVIYVGRGGHLKL